MTGALVRTADQQPLVRFADRREISPDRNSRVNISGFNSMVFWKEVQMDASLFAAILQDDTAKKRHPR